VNLASQVGALPAWRDARIRTQAPLM